MLDTGMLEQLRSVFANLDGKIELRMDRPSDPSALAQVELRELLADVAQTSGKIELTESDEASDAPRFELIRDGKATRVSFRGVPGGHEFSSLILSILYVDGKGKRPDEGVQARIRALKGPIHLKTYISLSCENCPEVVQALNLMASIHPGFHHEMVDGAVAEKEVEALGLQGVPAVVSDGILLHSGRIQIIDLVAKLESAFGTEYSGKQNRDLGQFDVAVIGGGPAGISAAIYSARKGLKTAIVAEKLGGQLQETKGIENMISMPYTEGPKLAAQLSEHASQYPIQLLEYRRVNSISDGPSRKVELESGERLEAKTVIIATGAKWRELGVPGEKEHIGQGVAFCAHCDGPFYKGKKVAVVGGGNSGVEAAIDLAGIAREVVLLEYGEKLRADGVLVEKLVGLKNATVLTQAKTTRIIGDGKKVSALEYQDRKSGDTRTIELDGVFVQIGLLPNSKLVQGMVELTPYGEIVVDPKGRTSAPGIYAAGDVTTIPFKQIVTAMGDGAKVALTAFEDRMRESVSKSGAASA